MIWVGALRDFKSFTSRSIRKLLTDNNSVKESRREWMYFMMKRAGIKNSNNTDFQFWIQGSHPIVLDSNQIIGQTLDYIHNNLVVAGFVIQPHHYKYSSAIDYMSEQKGMIEIIYAV